METKEIEAFVGIDPCEAENEGYCGRNVLEESREKCRLCIRVEDCLISAICLILERTIGKEHPENGDNFTSFRDALLEGFFALILADDIHAKWKKGIL